MPLPTVAPWSPTACRFTEQQKPRVLVSLAAVGLFMAVGWPLIVYYTGWWGLVKFWLMPWLGYHFWMSEYCSPLLAARTCYAMLRCHIHLFHSSPLMLQALSLLCTTRRRTSLSSPLGSGMRPRRSCLALCTATTPG